MLIGILDGIDDLDDELTIYAFDKPHEGRL